LSERWRVSEARPDLLTERLYQIVDDSEAKRVASSGFQ